MKVLVCSGTTCITETVRTGFTIIQDGWMGGWVGGWIWVTVSGSTSPDAPRPKFLTVCVPPLVPPIISRGAPLHVKQNERPLLVKDGIMGEKRPVNFAWGSNLNVNRRGLFTCRKSATWDRRLHFPSEGRHSVDFFA
jgi:hypothetical protein